MTDLITYLITIASSILALAMFSMLYKENVFYRFAEYTMLGLSIGIAIVAAYKSIVGIGVQAVLAGKWEMALPIVLGFLIYARYSRSIKWAGYLPIAVLVGIGVGLAVRGAIIGQFLDQIVATIKPLSLTSSLLSNINILLILIGTVTSLSYFVFTIEQKKGIGSISKLGRYFIMVSFGAQFGSVTITFLSPVLAPLKIMTADPGIYFSILAIALVIFDIFRIRQKTKINNTSPVS